MNSEDKSAGLAAAARQRFQSLHRGLLRLHKVLLDEERAAYEKAHGRISPGNMLQLVISDPQFAWLRRISELIVQIDEAMELKESGAAAGAADLLKQVRSLLAPGAVEGEFGRKYQEALQRLPDAVLAHQQVAAVLAADE